MTVSSLQFKFEGVFMRRFCTLVFVLACSLSLISVAQTQSGKGSIVGRVTDSSSGALVGAQVTVQPTGVSVVSDARGQFFINDLEPGSYTVTITYVGFGAFTQTLNVAAGHAANVDAKLAVESQNLQVLVTAERDEGEGKYVQVRGTEPRLTNTTIDGINVPSPESGVRQIKFDAIPADIVESVEINKTLQANMDGDGIGGSINLVTKTASERPTVALSGMGGYMPILGGRAQYETTGTVGQRFGQSKRFGILVGGSYDWTGRGIDDIEPVSDVATFPGGATQV